MNDQTEAAALYNSDVSIPVLAARHLISLWIQSAQEEPRP